MIFNLKFTIRLCIALVFLPFYNLISVQAQNYAPDQVFPIDSKVRVGHLDNGFTYYIRKNNRPENRIEMRLVINAGSILETDKQQGLAHLIEHMAFNGSKHFEKNDLIKYLESIGVSFGADLNAYTSFDETVYMLTVPSNSEDQVDKSFMVMQDWAFNLTLDTAEIDKERYVVKEEWRLGQGAEQRMQDQYFPVLFKDSRYAERLPIGKMDVVEHCDYEELTDFYKTWYRPNLMALVVVGDIDPDVAEQKIKKYFSEYKNPEDVKNRDVYDIPDHEGTLAKVVTDEEAAYTVVQVINKSDVLGSETGVDYLEMIKSQCVSGMFNRRIQVLSEQADPPFIGAGCYYGGLFARSKNAFVTYAAVADDGIEKGVSTLLQECKRITDYGFTQGELERFKLDLLKRYEASYNERNKTESAQLAAEYTRNFLENESIPGIEFEYNFLRANIDLITLDDVNTFARNIIKPDNRVILATGPKNGRLVSYHENALLTLAADIENKELTPYQDKQTASALMESLPKKGKIKKEERIESIDATELILSNGARVILKSTDFKNDQIVLTAYAWGGTSLVDDEDHFTSLNVDGIVRESGVASFSNSDLTKLLAGKTAYVANTLGEFTENVSANCRPADLETMMQLLYLKFTTPRKDLESFQAYISKNKSFYKNMARDPDNYFYDQYNRIKAQNNPRGNYLPKESDWDKISYDRVYDIYEDLYSNAREFTFIIVGAFDIDSIKPLITQYIGALPSNKKIRSYRDLGIRLPEGLVEKDIHKGNEPKAMAIISFEQETSYNAKDAFIFNQLAKHLNRKYLEVLREEMSGVYGVSATSDMSKVPYESASLSITIPCSPDNVDSLVAAALKQIKIVQTEGVSDADLNKLKEIYRIDKESNLKKNSWWLGAIKRACQLDGDFEKIASYDELDYITSDDLKRVANSYINLDEYLKVVHYPENGADE